LREWGIAGIEKRETFFSLTPFELAPFLLDTGVSGMHSKEPTLLVIDF